MNFPWQRGNLRERTPISAPLRYAFRTAGAAVSVLALTAFDLRLIHANSATAGFTFIVLILGLATWVGLRESITASLLSVAVYNFFFLPPVGTFTIADPQNWVALFAFLATAITVSQLSSNARRKAEEARARQDELERMYDFSRGLILGKEDRSLADQIISQIFESFGVQGARFYDSATGITSKIEGAESVFQDSQLVEVANSGRVWKDESAAALIVPVRLGGASLGSLGLAGKMALSEVGLQAVAQLIAIAIERARVQEIAARNEATRENEQLKSTLLDALAHEFKTPLTSVKAATTTLLSATTLNVLEQRELISIVNEEADRMTRLVNDSIELARMGTETLALQKELCTPEQIIFSALEELRSLFEGRNVKVAIDSDLPLIMVDRALSELALRQILNNALKYSPADSEIEVEAVKSEGFVTVSVSNRGPGITEVEKKRIFEKFYRGRDVRTRIPGTGMGLNISQQIVEAQGGRIWVQSESQKGVTFFVTFPIDCSPEAPGKAMQESEL
jgi:two-component system sensor histidine kinase KdpD